MFKNQSGFASLLIPAVTALAISLPLPAASFVQSDGAGYSTVWERFSAFDEDSEVKVNHQPLDAFLRQTVLPVGRSKARMGTQARQTTYTGSRVRASTSASPSKFESNRVVFHAFTDEHVDFLKGYKEGLERLSNRRPLRELNKNEQLAFWLNLYNVTVMEKIAGEYPIQKLKSLRQSKRQTPFWSEKSVTVEGMPLSLVDIEQILFRNWDDPRVMYGLYQGSIGGPSLPNVAFTVDNVWILLNNNALEFVNSNRGVRPKGATSAEISKMYDWASAAFGNSDAAVIAHIRQFADAFHSDMTGLRSIKPKYYDWNIADLTGGTLHKGQHTQLGGVLVAGPGRLAGDQNRPDPGLETFETFGNDIMGVYDMIQGLTPLGPLTILPPQAQDLLGQMLIHNDIPDRTPSVTVIDCDVEEIPEQPADMPEADKQPPAVILD